MFTKLELWHLNLTFFYNLLFDVFELKWLIGLTASWIMYLKAQFIYFVMFFPQILPLTGRTTVCGGRIETSGWHARVPHLINAMFKPTHACGLRLCISYWMYNYLIYKRCQWEWTSLSTSSVLSSSCVKSSVSQLAICYVQVQYFRVTKISSEFSAW